MRLARALWRRTWNPERRVAFVPDRALEAAQAFLHTEASGGIVLIVAAMVALAWVNLGGAESYDEFWHTTLSLDIGLISLSDSLQHYVNDGLMAIFFFVVGLEIKRELEHGELADRRRALLPALAALGGMIVPALIYVGFTAGGDGSRGWGIPMATDIAFAVGVMALVGSRVPFAVKIFLLALAIVDDLGAILVIAIFYSSDLSFSALAVAAALVGVIVAMNRMGVRSIPAYIAVGALVWLAMYESGVHPTIAGVVLGLLTPSRPLFDPSAYSDEISRLADNFRAARAREDRGDQEELLKQIERMTQGSQAPLERLERTLHPPVSFFIMPVFALANAGVLLSGDAISDAIASPVTHGVLLGLVVGKPVGILAFAWIGVRLRLCALPAGSGWPQMAGAGILAGIGFTVSLFITSLAFADNGTAEQAKIGIFAASVIAGVAGYTLLRAFSPAPGSRAVPAPATAEGPG